MKDWRSWAWLSFVIATIACSSCTAIETKSDNELKIKTTEYEYKVTNLEKL